MSTTAPPQSSSASAVRPPPAAPPRSSGVVRAPGTGRQHRLVLAVLLIVAGAAIGAALYLSGDSRQQVVVAARDIPAGTVISADDLGTAEISGSGVSAVAGADASRLLGQTATSLIPAGALLHADMVDPAPPPGPGQVAVGLALTAGQLPVTELAPARLVEVMQVPAAADGGSPEPAVGVVLVEEAEVLSVSADVSGAWLVTVAVDRADAPAVTAAAAAGRVTLGLLPVGTTTGQQKAPADAPAPPAAPDTARSVTPPSAAGEG